jgi:hypothetical protein
VKIIMYKTIVLLVVLHECESLCLPLREEHKLKKMRRLFGPEWDEVMRGRRKLHNEELVIHTFHRI